MAAGLAEAKLKSQPLVAVFTTACFDGSPTFKGDLLRTGLKAAKIIPVKVLPPQTPKVPAGTSADDVKKLRASHAEAVKKYTTLARKHGVTKYHTMVFMTPEGEVVTRLVNPNQSQVHRTLVGLDKLLKRLKAAKAKAAAEKAKAAGDKAKAG